MKTRYILLGLVMLSAVVFAEIGPPYDNSKPPPLPLPAAYQFAVVALGSATNEFHCVSASMTRDFGAPRWSFTFYSTNQPPRRKILTVDKAGKVQEDSGART
jgi:hypothetical protein